MKIKILKDFKDKNTNKLIKAGTIIEANQERAEEIIAKGFANPLAKKEVVEND